MQFLLTKFLVYNKLNLLKLHRYRSTIKLNMPTNTKISEVSKTKLKSIFHAALKAVAPKNLIIDQIKINNNVLQFQDQKFQLNEKVYLVGFGKAVMKMAVVLESMLGNSLQEGVINCPMISTEEIWLDNDKTYFPKLKNSKIKYNEVGENNLPDDRSWKGTHDIIDLVEKLTENDTLIVLISGGGSACLYMPRPTIDSEDKINLIKSLQNAGADISELNIVRQKLSMVKGGGLARMAFPAQVLAFVLSDIVGDPFHLIASGPTTYSKKDPEEVIKILRKYNLFDNLDNDSKKVIRSKEVFKDNKLIQKSTKQFKHVTNLLIGNNLNAIRAAVSEAYNQKLIPIILGNNIVGNVHDVSLTYAHVTSLICQVLDKTLSKEDFINHMQKTLFSFSIEEISKMYYEILNNNNEGIVLIGAGEPTVIVRGSGKGGRNQELALHFSLDWLAQIKSNPQYAEYNVVMLSAGTDGQDGPTDAAGAFGYPDIEPEIHNLYYKVKHLAQIEEEKVEFLKNVKKPKFEEIADFRQKSKCETQELSGFITSKNIKKDTAQQEEGINTNNGEFLSAESLHMTLKMMEVERMLPLNALKNNDTYNLYSRFKNGADLLKTGLTNTNVMDLHFIIIHKEQCFCGIDENNIENDFLSKHDLTIDSKTIEKLKSQHIESKYHSELKQHDEFSLNDEQISDLHNLNIIEENFKDPCCNKIRKILKLDSTIIEKFEKFDT